MIRKFIALACAPITAALLLLGLVEPALAAGVRGMVSVGVVGTYIGTSPLTGVNPATPFNLNAVYALTEGAAANQAQYLYAAQTTIAASGSSNLDLAGAVTDVLGATLTCNTVRFIYVHAATGNTNNFNVGGAASNTLVGVFDDATDIARVKPGGTFLWIAPVTGATVTAATGDILKLANSSSGTSVTADIAIGCT